MGRQKGQPMYGGKSIGGSHYLTRLAVSKLRAAAQRTGKSDSDIIEHCLRRSADRLTRVQADRIAAAAARKAATI